MRAGAAATVCVAVSILMAFGLVAFGSVPAVHSRSTGLGSAPERVGATSANANLQVTLSISPSQVEVGNSVTIQAAASGGTPPYSYQYTGLPSDCPSQNSSSFSCNPSTPADYEVSVSVTDAASDSATSNPPTSLDVSSSNNGGNGGGGGGNNSSNPFSGLISGLGGILTYVLIFGLIGFVTWILLIVGIWIIAITLVRRLPKRGAASPATATVTCAACSAVIPAGTKFCPECGKSPTAKGA